MFCSDCQYCSRMAIGSMIRAPRVFPDDDIVYHGYTVPRGVSLSVHSKDTEPQNTDVCCTCPLDTHLHDKLLDAHVSLRFPLSAFLRAWQMAHRRPANTQRDARLLCAFFKGKQSLRCSQVSLCLILVSLFPLPLSSLFRILFSFRPCSLILSDGNKREE